MNNYRKPALQNLIYVALIQVRIIRNSTDFSHNLHVCRLTLMSGKFVLKLSVNSSIERCKCNPSEKNGHSFYSCISQDLMIWNCSCFLFESKWKQWSKQSCFIVLWVNADWHWALMQPTLSIISIRTLESIIIAFIKTAKHLFLVVSHILVIGVNSEDFDLVFI